MTSKSEGDFVQGLARNLKEGPAAMPGLANVVQTMGRDQASLLLKKALSIEAHGAAKTRDGSRWKTLGGIFFSLAKQAGWIDPSKIRKSAKPSTSEHVADLLRRIAVRASSAADSLLQEGIDPGRETIKKAARAMTQLLEEIARLTRQADEAKILRKSSRQAGPEHQRRAKREKVTSSHEKSARELFNRTYEELARKRKAKRKKVMEEYIPPLTSTLGPPRKRRRRIPRRDPLVLAAVGGKKRGNV